MALKKVEVDVEGDVYELAKGLGEFAAEVQKALKDGWQPGSDIAPIMAALMVLIPKLQGYANVPAAIEQYPVESGNAVLQGLLPVLKQL